MRLRTATLIAAPLALVSGAVIGLSTLDGEQPAAAAAAPATDTRLATAYRLCNDGTATRREQMTLADGERTLLLDTNPDDSQYGSTFGALNCLTRELRTPKAITSRIDRTTAMQGVQEGAADGIAYSWTYHPDNGAEITITYQEG